MPYLLCSLTIIKVPDCANITNTIVPRTIVIISDQFGITKGYFHLFLRLPLHVEIKSFSILVFLTQIYLIHWLRESRQIVCLH